jgi:hypothetical protein
MRDFIQCGPGVIDMSDQPAPKAPPATNPLIILRGPIIRAGESVSEPLDCREGTIIRLTMPKQWTGANLTFLVSSDGTDYHDLVDFDGNAVTMTVKIDTLVALAPLSEHLDYVYFKVRSGTRTHPIKQQAEREFTVALRRPV